MIQLAAIAASAAIAVGAHARPAPDGAPDDDWARARAIASNSRWPPPTAPGCGRSR